MTVMYNFRPTEITEHDYDCCCLADLPSRLRRSMRKKTECSGKKCKEFVFLRLPILNWLLHYRCEKDLLNDVISGVTVAIMNIPQGMLTESAYSRPETSSFRVQSNCFTSATLLRRVSMRTLLRRVRTKLDYGLGKDGNLRREFNKFAGCKYQ